MKIEYIATLFLFIALVHSFSTSFFKKWSHRFTKDSAAESFLHLLSEVEIVFGFWAFVFLSVWFLLDGSEPVIQYQQSLQMTEPLFIFCIMIMSSTRPIVNFSKQILLFMAKTIHSVVKVDVRLIQIFVLLGVGPLLGSFITEPAAMTILALLLYRMMPAIDEVEIQGLSNLKTEVKQQNYHKLYYSILALLFVNISIGGGLTHFAAPPILMVANKFGWSLKDVFINLGEPIIAAVITNTFLFLIVFKKQIYHCLKPLSSDEFKVPGWITFLHLLFLTALVLTSHYSQVFMGLFLIFIGVTTVTKKYQDGLKFKEAFLVAFFLGGLIVLGTMQKWWLIDVLSILKDRSLYFVATGLTAVTDNAALTYLGSLVEMTESSKWALVAGALSGGGLTILANAPNPAGFAILGIKFKDQSLNAFRLFIAALPFTVVVVFYFILFARV